MTPVNHRLGITQMWVRGTGDAESPAGCDRFYYHSVSSALLSETDLYIFTGTTAWSWVESSSFMHWSNTCKKRLIMHRSSRLEICSEFFTICQTGAAQLDQHVRLLSWQRSQVMAHSSREIHSLIADFQQMTGYCFSCTPIQLIDAVLCAAVSCMVRMRRSSLMYDFVQRAILHR
jgi:hypothetical protein